MIHLFLDTFLNQAHQVLSRSADSIKSFLPQGSDVESVVRELISYVTHPGPLASLVLFAAASFIMVWRLNAVERKGFEGTLTGTLVMPYCSGFANLAFAFVLGRSGGDGSLVLENCSVNNVTNLTLILGISSFFWKSDALKSGSGSGTTSSHVSYFSLVLSITALLFFTALLWLLAKDGLIDRLDGIVLTGVFIFWQMIHVIEVLKTNAINKRPFQKSIIMDSIIVLACAWATLKSIDTLVNWVTVNGKGFLSIRYLGFLSGILMVIPNGVLALYYSCTGKSDIAYSSQIGDCHICIPLCIGLFALFAPIRIPGSFMPAVYLIGISGLMHLVFLWAGHIPKLVGGIMAASYAIFIYFGIPG